MIHLLKYVERLKSMIGKRVRMASVAARPYNRIAAVNDRRRD
jgi:hypothetical protein